MTNKKYILDSMLVDGKKKNGESVTETSKENQLKTVDGSAKGNQSETGKVSYYAIFFIVFCYYFFDSILVLVDRL